VACKVWSYDRIQWNTHDLGRLQLGLNRDAGYLPTDSFAPHRAGGVPGNVATELDKRGGRAIERHREVEAGDAEADVSAASATSSLVTTPATSAIESVRGSAASAASASPIQTRADRLNAYLLRLICLICNYFPVALILMVGKGVSLASLLHDSWKQWAAAAAYIAISRAADLNLFRWRERSAAFIGAWFDPVALVVGYLSACLLPVIALSIHPEWHALLVANSWRRWLVPLNCGACGYILTVRARVWRKKKAAPGAPEGGRV
jgi:hypothetical protein